MWVPANANGPKTTMAALMRCESGSDLVTLWMRVVSTDPNTAKPANVKDPVYAASLLNLSGGDTMQL